MNIPQYARYEYCNRKACEFLEEYSINSFPVNVEEIIHRNRWGLVKYSQIMNDFHCDRQTVIRCLGSKDGYTIWDGENYTISYNDDDSLGNRTRFTLMHEVGHIYLNHLIDFESTKIYRGSLTKSENTVLENEANAFARNVLLPTTLLEKLKDQSVSNVSRQFGITAGAAKTRLDLYRKDSSLNISTGVMPNLKRIFYNFYHKKKCLTCGCSIIQKDILYCPICGTDSLKWGDGKMIYPIEIHLNERSKAIKCPVCDNEEIPVAGDYCPICGTMIVNKCTNIDIYGNGCGHLAAGNARYCIYCGSTTTFFEKNLLRAWDLEAPEDEYSPFPDDEEELPFN